jgi:hypothetical protein
MLRFGHYLIEATKADVDNLNDAKGKLFELLVGGHLKHGTNAQTRMPNGHATHYRPEGDGPQEVHDKLKRYLDTAHPGSYEQIAKHASDAANHLRGELAARGHTNIDDVAWTSQAGDHRAFTGHDDPNATADLMVKSRNANGEQNEPIGLSLKYGKEKNPNLKNPGLGALEGLSRLKSGSLDKLRQGHYDVLKKLGYGDKVGGKAAKERYNQLYAAGDPIAAEGDAHALQTQRDIAAGITQGLGVAAKKDPQHLSNVVKQLLFPPTMYSTLRHHTHTGKDGSALHHTNDTEDEAQKTANSFEEYRVRPHSGGVTAVIEGRRKGSDKFEPAVNLSTKTTSSYSGKGFNAIVKAPFLTKKTEEEPPVAGPVTQSAPATPAAPAPKATKQPKVSLTTPTSSGGFGQNRGDGPVEFPAVDHKQYASGQHGGVSFRGPGE